MNKGELIYEGKAKRIFSVENDSTHLVAEFKDDLTAFNAQKKSSEEGKGALNLKISTQLFNLLTEKGIKTHFVENISDRDMLVKKVDIILIEVVVRNIATGSLTRRLGIEDGKKLPFTLIEFYYKNDDMNDPIITDEHAIIMELAKSQEELAILKSEAKKVNDILIPFFAERNLNLVDFKLEFGRLPNGEIILADELSPDNCRFWDMETGEKLDKDRFREGIGGIKVAYEEVLKRIM
ncbi:phosphoribosylaminoimidazole-succinocarboxamide synthase [Thiovulum sp. ES]|nr:phosphoribosylaminoimidazole-succinocarboxamide synthase [Thiovulum sp. ES]